MCLRSIRERIDKPSTLIEDGWKKFDGNDSHAEFSHFSLSGKREVPLNQWIKAEGPEILSAHGDRYRGSFHVYEDEDQARRCGATRRVYVRRVHTRGTEDSKTVMVAEEMYVPSNPNDWPPKGGLLDKLKSAANKKAGNA